MYNIQFLIYLPHPFQLTKDKGRKEDGNQSKRNILSGKQMYY